MHTSRYRVERKTEVRRLPASNPMCERSGYGEQAAKRNTSLQRQTTMLGHGRLRETQLLRAGVTNLLYYKKGTNAGSARGNLEKP